jgi:hypothetical protein
VNTRVRTGEFDSRPGPLPSAEPSAELFTDPNWKEETALFVSDGPLAILECSDGVKGR